MNVLFVASEAFPLIKTGGLADVAGTLPLALGRAGVDVRLLLPNYSDPKSDSGESISAKLQNLEVAAELGNPLGFGDFKLLTGATREGLKVWLLDCPELYQSEGGPYLGSDGRDHANNAERFAALAWVGATLAINGGLIGWRADIVHAHDWQAGLIGAYFQSWRVQHSPLVFTIHNLQFTGVFKREQYPSMALDERLYGLDGLEYYGDFSMLKAGLQYADIITTVSPTYAREIQTAEFGCGLEGLLQKNSHKLRGILNGVDYNLWDPSRDTSIAKTYGPRSLGGKAENRRALLEANHLPVQEHAPVFGVVSRLTGQKGLDLVLDTLPSMVERGAQLVVLGSGDADLEQAYRDAAARYPEHVAVRIGYDEDYSHLLQAGCDCLLVPSRFEPCGLTQLYALKYATLPVVRRTGGLADSVNEWDSNRPQTGFMFDYPSSDDLGRAMHRAIDAYADKKHWLQLLRNAMKQDFSWDKAAENYLSMYRGLLA